MNRQVTPPKRVTSPDLGSPPPCKQSLRLWLHWLVALKWCPKYRVLNEETTSRSRSIDNWFKLFARTFEELNVEV